MKNTLLKHQQKIVALGYAAQMCAQWMVFPVSTKRKKAIKELLALHDFKKSERFRNDVFST